MQELMGECAHNPPGGKNMKAPNGRSLIFQSETVTWQRCQARTAGIDGIEALELEQADGEVIWQLRQEPKGQGAVDRIRRVSAGHRRKGWTHGAAVGAGVCCKRQRRGELRCRAALPISVRGRLTSTDFQRERSHEAVENWARMRLQFDCRARRRSSETKNAGRSNLASQFSGTQEFGICASAETPQQRLFRGFEMAGRARW